MEKVAELFYRQPNYSAILVKDLKRKNQLVREGIPKERIFTPSTVKANSKGKMLVSPNYLIVEDADLLLGYYTGQPIGAMIVDGKVIDIE